MELRDYFDRIYVINLKSRPDRRREMTKELSRVGLTPADGKVEFFDACKVDDQAGFPSRGARGCFLSHLGVLKQARSLGLANVCVIEDDQDFEPDFDRHQAELVRELRRRDWDMAYFGYRIWEGEANPETLQLARELRELGRPDHATFRQALPQHNVLTTAFYAVNGPAVRDRAIAALEAIMSRPPGHPDGGPMHVDGAYNMFRRANPDVRTLIATPSVSAERPSWSDVTPGRLDRYAALGPVMGVARWAKRLVKTGKW